MRKIFLLSLILSGVFTFSACSDKRQTGGGAGPYVLPGNSAITVEEAVPYDWFSKDLDPAISEVAKKIIPVDHFITGTSYAQSATQKRLDLSALKMGQVGEGTAQLKVEIAKGAVDVVAPDGYTLIKDKDFGLEDNIFEKYLLVMTTETGQQISVGTVCRSVKEDSTVEVRISKSVNDANGSKVSGEDCEKYLSGEMTLNINPNFEEAISILKKWLSAAPCAVGSVELGSTTIRKAQRLPTSVASIDVRHACNETSAASVYIQKNRFEQNDRIVCEGEILEFEDRHSEVCVNADGTMEVNARNYYIRAKGLASPESLLDILQLLSVKPKDVGFSQAVKK